MKANVPENIAHEELIAMRSNPRALAIGLLRFSKAVHATVLELDDLFEAILAPAESYERPSAIRERCDSCTRTVRCVYHLNADDRKSVTREIWAVRPNVAIS